MTYETHSAAELFPLMEGCEFDQLTADIATNGQRESITLYEGKILDGRNRYRACLNLGIEPRVEPYVGDEPYAYVISLNAKRRNLNESQLGMIAVAALPKLEEEARRRQAAAGERGKEGGRGNQKPLAAPAAEGLPPDWDQGRAIDRAGTSFGISGDTVDHARKVIERGAPEVVAMVRNAKVAVKTAAVVVSLPLDEQRMLAARGPTAIRAKASSMKRAERCAARAGAGNSAIRLSRREFNKLRAEAKALRALCVDRFELWKHGSIRKQATEIVEMLDALTKRGE